MERSEILSTAYSQFNEDIRLAKSRQGQLEFLTTLHYIHELVPAGAKVIEIGAGTGRYSVQLAREGYKLTAVELLERNFETLQHKARGLENLTPFQGDALNLRMFANDSFDAVLLLGPMYHLYDKADLQQALDEAIRLVKPGGIVMSAFLSCYAIMYNDYLVGNFGKGLELNFDATGQTRHFKEQVFTGFDILEFEELFTEKPVRRITTLGTDSILELAERDPMFQLSDEDFAKFVKFHLQNCEKRELLGSQSHLLHICRKEAV